MRVRRLTRLQVKNQKGFEIQPKCKLFINIWYTLSDCSCGLYKVSQRGGRSVNCNY